MLAVKLTQWVIVIIIHHIHFLISVKRIHYIRQNQMTSQLDYQLVRVSKNQFAIIYIADQSHF